VPGLMKVHEERVSSMERKVAGPRKPEISGNSLDFKGCDDHH